MPHIYGTFRQRGCFRFRIGDRGAAPPKDRLERLQNLFKETLADPGVQAKFAKVNMATNYLPDPEFGKVIADYHKLFGNLSARHAKRKNSLNNQHFDKRAHICTENT